jgi:hypothetical protein
MYQHAVPSRPPSELHYPEVSDPFALLTLSRMVQRRLSPLLIVLTSLITACETNRLGTVDVSTDVPFLSDAIVSPDSIYIDSQTPVNGRYTISASARVKATAQTRNLHVQLTVLRPSGSAIVGIVDLRDDGIQPDQVAYDSIYSGAINFTIERSAAGRYRVRFEATTDAGASGNAIEHTLKIGRRNSPPVLHSVSVPDSVTLPTNDTLFVQFTATVSDSDGLGDIREMAFRRISPPDPTKFFMKDDGGLDPPIEIGPPGAGIRVRSGDDVAGDGRYSFLIPITPSAVRRTNVFLFQAVDSFGDTSRSIIDSLTVR